MDRLAVEHVGGHMGQDDAAGGDLAGDAGATTVKMSPAMKVVVEAIVNVAVVPPAAKTMVPTFEPFFRML